MRYVLIIAYDGTEYAGWQTQKNAVTIQETIERAASELFGAEVKLHASGRTDSGVHALGQVAHFDASLSLPAEKIADALNAVLPPDISVLSSSVAPDGFDANLSAKKKTYVYRMYFGKRRNPMCDRYAFFVRGECDIGVLNGAASLFVGEHDFAAYCASKSSAKTTVRTVFETKFYESEDFFGRTVSFEVTGGGFLYNMVRTMAGTALDCMLGKVTASDIEKSLSSPERSLVGRTLPAKGLTLVSVDYSPFVFA
ncbi:MAG: tRNA pseudouridine(38-40) synthase TruA [Clostridia bacterium]|nr:tRNA pseudouridine(38-40) synthase TruA [Clostridia bacterium]